MNALVYVADIETHEILFLNDYGTRLFGPEGIGKACFKTLQSGQTTPCAFCTNDKLVIDGVMQPPYVWEFQNTVTGRWFLCIDRAIAWTDGRLVRMEIAVDISERKRAEQFREDYIGLISHDLRSPLTYISSMAQILEDRMTRHCLDQEAGMAKKIVQNAQRMDAMIHDLAESAHLEGGKPQLQIQSLNLSQIISDLVTQMGITAGENRIELVSRQVLPTVNADRQRIERVILNLLTNALKYSPTETAVVVEVEADDNEALVTVRNRGAGIRPDEIKNLFQRYYRAPATAMREGLGLGLYIARLIVEAHGGRIWVESTPGIATTFNFTLPINALVHD